MKDAYYFPHDHNARGDDKIIPLRKAYGWQGYGLFWAIVEKLYESGGSIQQDYSAIAFDLQAEEKMVKGLIEMFGLFDIRKGKIRSRSVDARLEKIIEKSNKASISSKKRWGMRTQCERNANALPSDSERNATAMLEMKGNEMKGNERIGASPRPSFKAPSLEEIATYCQERKNAVDPQKWLDHYTANGWKVGRNPMKDWKAAVRNWEKSEFAPYKPKFDEAEYERGILRAQEYSSTGKIAEDF